MGNPQLMEELWQEMSATVPEGQRLRIPNRAALKLSYEQGFVDAVKFSLQDWLKAFEPYQQKDGAFVLDHNQWMQLTNFHYDGPIDEPFYPLNLKTELVLRENFELLLDVMLVPSTSLGLKAKETILNFCTQQNLLQKTGVNITEALKIKLHELVEAYPSPLRNLQLGFAREKSDPQGKLHRQAKTTPVSTYQNQPKKPATVVGNPQPQDSSILKELEEIDEGE